MLDKEKLRQQLVQLHGELRQIDSTGSGDRGLLEKLAADVQAILDRDEIEDHHYVGLNERLRDALARVEVTHPTATWRLRELIEELAYLGV